VLEGPETGYVLHPDHSFTPPLHHAMKKPPAINDLLKVMARLRSPDGCPWDREQSHHSLRWHAVEEVYELIDAIEAKDDHEMEEELGDLLLQVVFHCQLAKERDAFDFEQVARHITEKLIRRHPHVFGNLKVKDVDQVWANWEKIKRAEKHGTHRARPSALDGVPKHLPALQRAERRSCWRTLPKLRQSPGRRWPDSCWSSRATPSPRAGRLRICSDRRLAGSSNACERRSAPDSLVRNASLCSWGPGVGTALQTVSAP